MDKEIINENISLIEYSFPTGTVIEKIIAWPGVAEIYTSEGVYQFYGSVCKKLNTCV